MVGLINFLVWQQGLANPSPYLHKKNMVLVFYLPAEYVLIFPLLQIYYALWNNPNSNNLIIVTRLLFC